MHASVGDRIEIQGHRIGEPSRNCEVLESKGPDGTAPFRVRWDDSGHETIFFPGSDASVHHYEHHGEPATR